MTAKDNNLHMLEVIARGLQELCNEVVFVGGATTILYLSYKNNDESITARPTDDVDCVIEVTSRTEYRQLEKRIRRLGFKNVIEPNIPICRWVYAGIKVDIMPTESNILGFTNRWYTPGIVNAITITLPSKMNIRIFTTPYFLASKIEAFNHRGKNDFLASSDFEDIMTVLDGRESILKDLFECPEDVKIYLHQHFQSWIQDNNFLQSIVANLQPKHRSADNARRILDIIQSI